MEQPNIFAAFCARIERHVQDAQTQYRSELEAVSHEMAAKGLHNSGAHLKRRVGVLRKWTQTLTDQCFEDVTRLPGQQDIHRMLQAEFLAEQLNEFLRQGEAGVLVFDPGSDATVAIKKLIAEIHKALESDLTDFQAGLWRSREQRGISSVTTNTLNIHRSTVGAIQQAGDGATQSASVVFNTGAVQTALEEFVTALNGPDIPEQIRNEAMIEVDSIRPQLRKASPSVSIVHEGLRSLRTIVEGVSAGILTAKVLAVMAAAGIAISQLF